MNVPVVSVLLVSWNTREETRRCLDALGDATSGGVRYEIVAVDNASADGSAELLAADPRVRLIRNQRNAGLAAAVNQAYRQAEGELILLLNSDVRFHPGALDSMVEFLRDRPDAAGVSPLQLNPDGSLQQVRPPNLPTALALCTGPRRPATSHARSTARRFRSRHEDLSRPREAASGRCLLLRRTALGSQGILDERFPIYWNDAVLVHSLRDAGHRLWTIPQAVATRTPGASRRRLGTAPRTRHLVGGLVRYLRLTQPPYRVEVFRLALLVDHAVRRLCRRPTSLGLRDLILALRGDVGPLPGGDLRNWAVLSGDGPWAAEHYFRTVLGDRVADHRTLLVERPRAERRWRLNVRFDGSSVWRATPPALLPFGERLPVVQAMNRRFAAATLRRWLDEHPGARVLRLDDTSRYLVGRIDEDEVVPTRTPELELSRD